MKKLAGAILAASLLWVPGGVQAETGKCVQPSLTEIKGMLTKAAIENEVPVEIVKAIALRESKIKQCDENGNPILNSNRDGGIGIMQVTLSDAEYTEKGINKDLLENDPAYNIKIGIQILIDKYNFKKNPPIENQSQAMLEHWYFAVRNYNGNTSGNSAENNTAYQNIIYSIIKNNGLVSTAPFPLTGYNQYLDQKVKEMKWSFGYTQTMGNLKDGDRVLIKKTDPYISPKLRDAPSLSSKYTSGSENTVVEIIGNDKYEVQETVPKNLFHFYKVKVNGQIKYISSSNLKPLRIESENPLSINSSRREGYGRIKLLKDVKAYTIKNGSEQVVKTYKKGEALKVSGTKNGAYIVSPNLFVDHDPSATSLIIGNLLYLNQFKHVTKLTPDGYILEDKRVVGYEDAGKMILGYVEVSKQTAFYKPGGGLNKPIPAKQRSRVYSILPDRYDLGGGNYIFKANTTYSPVYGGN